MDSFEKIQRKQQARQRVRAQREHAGRLKTRVVVSSLVCFALLWGIVFVQMATGNDPVLGDSSSTIAKANGGRKSNAAKAAPAETGASTDSERLEAAEAEAVEAEPVEEEFVEAEAEEFEELAAEPVEEEPAPVTTSQS
jgi:hypothetical protein